MSSIAKLASLGLVSLLAAACSAAPSAGTSEDVASKGEALSSGVYGSISASPNPAYVSPGEQGPTTISWTWSQSSQQYLYACVYVQFNGGAPQVFDCEKQNNLYKPVAPWLQPGNHYVFGIIPQQAPVQMAYSDPVPWIASVDVNVIETCSSACTAAGYNGDPISCNSAPGATCSETESSVTCGGVTTKCVVGDTCRNPCDGPNDDGIPVSCTPAPGTACTVNQTSVTCNGVTTQCRRGGGCQTC
jgi:hypothetical protein